MATDTVAPEIRRARTEEGDDVVTLAASALRWSDAGPHRALFAWKHHENPFGPSPCWVADDDGALVGVRTFLRWRWRGPDGDLVAAVRAVDTATHPDHQGRGIFLALTAGAVGELRAEGVSFIFNTPNQRSLPGYVRLGWRCLGRIPVAVRPSGLGGLRRITTARAAAEKWSERCDVGVPAPEFFADTAAVARLLAARSPAPRLRTDHSPAYLKWRYGFAPLAYRCLPLGEHVEDGALVFRLRRRGGALEATICENLTALAPHRLGTAVDRLLRHTGADYAIGTRWDLPGISAVPAPGVGPVLTWRDLNLTMPAHQSDFALSLGDIELF